MKILLKSSLEKNYFCDSNCICDDFCSCDCEECGCDGYCNYDNETVCPDAGDIMFNPSDDGNDECSSYDCYIGGIIGEVIYGNYN